MRTGCLSILKKQDKIKNSKFSFVKKVTILSAFFVCSHFITTTAAETLSSGIVQQEKTSNYNRMIFFAGRDQLNFKKNGATIQIRTLNEELFQSLKSELESVVAESS